MRLLKNIFSLFGWGKKKPEPNFHAEMHSHNSVPVRDITNDDIKKLSGRVTYDRHGSAKSIFLIRNKKTGVLVVFRGTAEDAKERFVGDDFEAVESAIKENNAFETDLNSDEFFGEK